MQTTVTKKAFETLHTFECDAILLEISDRQNTPYTPYGAFILTPNKRPVLMVNSASKKDHTPQDPQKTALDAARALSEHLQGLANQAQALASDLQALIEQDAQANIERP